MSDICLSRILFMGHEGQLLETSPRCRQVKIQFKLIYSPYQKVNVKKHRYADECFTYCAKYLLYKDGIYEYLKS